MEPPSRIAVGRTALQLRKVILNRVFNFIGAGAGRGACHHPGRVLSLPEIKHAASVGFGVIVCLGNRLDYVTRSARIAADNPHARAFALAVTNMEARSDDFIIGLTTS